MIDRIFGKNFFPFAQIPSSPSFWPRQYINVAFQNRRGFSDECLRAEKQRSRTQHMAIAQKIVVELSQIFFLAAFSMYSNNFVFVGQKTITPKCTRQRNMLFD